VRAKEWEKAIKDCKSSGKSVRDWCEKNGYSYSSYRYWYTKLNNRQQEWTQVLPVQEPVKTNTSEITIQCGIFRIEIKEGFSAKLLSDILTAVKSV